MRCRLQNSKFVSPKPSDRISLAGGTPKTLGPRLRQQFIADGVPECVVNRLELIEVKKV